MYIKYDSVQVYSGFSLCVIHDANGTLIGLCAQATQRAFVVKYCQKSIVKILCQLCNSNLIKYFLFLFDTTKNLLYLHTYLRFFIVFEVKF